MAALIFVLVLILLAILVTKMIIAPYFDRPLFGDDMYETHTTVTTTTTTEAPTYDIVGNLKRQWEGNQTFVIDPVDGAKLWLNTKDDMYEDADGKIWKLID